MRKLGGGYTAPQLAVSGGTVEYLDLSVYEYTRFPIPMRCVGWLGRERGMQSNGASPVAAADLELVRSSSRHLGRLMLGTHDCEFCPGGSIFEGNGEYRYYLQDGEVYSAPMMIIHYMESHGYKPPRVFLEHLRKSGRLSWDWRAARLSEVLLNESESVSIRCEAAIDLARWRDHRALDALIHVALDEELVDAAGEEIGKSIGLLLSSGLVGGVCVDEFPDEVRYGISQFYRA
ncbi:hypothetical protein [Kitasatospora sp. SC0581]|uniref:DUF7919 family protein n=1 Tax=Kitasatospora sp. SC0581 TaxID=3394360 RepID=UPI003A88B81F